MNQVNENNVISAFYNKKSFVKIKQCLQIGKILFSFVNMENSKASIDCYMEAEEFGALLMADIRNASLFRKISEEKQRALTAGETYPKSVWSSPVGGTKKGPNGSPVSRSFSIAPGSQSEIVITAQMYPAEVNATGAFITVKGSKPITTIRVSCTFNDLRILQYKWSYLEQDYMKKKYNMEAMKTEWNGSRNNVNNSERSTMPNNVNTSSATEMSGLNIPNDGTNYPIIECVTQGEVKSYSSGQKSIAIHRPGSLERIGTLYVKPELQSQIDLKTNQTLRIITEKKEDNYLFMGIA